MYIGGAVVAASGTAMLPAALVSVLHREWSDAAWIAAAAGLTAMCGLIATLLVGRRGEFTAREGFAAVGLAWFLMSAFGTLPYLLTGTIPSVTDAFFESAAGFTTTGSSIVPDPGALSHGILIWRAITQWIGGMGVIVLSIAILPLLGVGGMQLARAEAPGPEPDRLTPRFRETAKRLWLLYAAATSLLFVLLWAGEMTPFEAIAHALTTMPTGGFGTDAGSLGAFSAYSQWVVIVFMFLAGTSFALHWRALTSRTPSAYWYHPEFRLYAALCLLAVALGTYANRGAGGFEEVIRGGAFTAISLTTTTGYATVDFGQWAAGMQIFTVGLMFLGGMAGSTSGAVKSFRIGVLTRAALVDLRRLVHPKGVFITRLGKDPVPDQIVDSVRSFFLFYMFIFMTGTVAMGIIESHLGVGQDLVTSVSAVASAMGNIGPGLAEVGPAENYAGVPAAGKWLLASLMIVGRLEIFPVLLIFTRALWRR
jgi:trk system potassium uptake protein